MITIVQIPNRWFFKPEKLGSSTALVSHTPYTWNALQWSSDERAAGRWFTESSPFVGGTESSPSVVHVGRSLLVDTAAGGGNSTLIEAVESC